MIVEVDRTKAEELSVLSKITGQDERFVQAGGGNTSVKLDQHLMLIKSSGIQLTEMTADDGYSVVDYQYIVDAFNKQNVDDSRENEMLSACLLEGRRPSIETFLHSITQKYTSHSHPLGVTSCVSSKEGLAHLRTMFPDAVFVPYETPGIKLARVYFSAMNGVKDKRIIFLENHGLVVSADTLEEVIQLQMEVVCKIDEYLGLDVKGIEIGQNLFGDLQKICPGKIAYRVESNAVKEALNRNPEGWDHAFSPDCVVYCGKRILSFPQGKPEMVKNYYENYGDLRVVIREGYVFAIAENLKKAKDIAAMLDFSAKVSLSIGERIEKKTLKDEERDFLLGWDAEKYRTSLK